MLWVLLTVLCSVMVAVAGVVLCCVTLWKLLAVMFIVLLAVAGVVLCCVVGHIYSVVLQSVVL